jgi:prepilin-type N-terminal cleavage/methylation domain-containing protein
LLNGGEMQTRERGFTLVEIAIVLVIIGLLLAAS